MSLPFSFATAADDDGGGGDDEGTKFWNAQGIRVLSLIISQLLLMKLLSLSMFLSLSLLELLL